MLAKKEAALDEAEFDEDLDKNQAAEDDGFGYVLLFQTSIYPKRDLKVFCQVGICSSEKKTFFL